VGLTASTSADLFGKCLPGVIWVYLADSGDIGFDGAGSSWWIGEATGVAYEISEPTSP
jgi:hypothetical protein